MEREQTDDRSGALLYRHGRPEELVRAFPTLDRLTGVIVAPDAPALVLGSTQPLESIDGATADALGLPRVRRRSGGGGVVVRPGAQLWIDIFVPTGHHLASHDVHRSAMVAGAIWTDALGPLLRDALTVHVGPLIETPWSRIDCFSGVGPGEVLLGGRKLVGVSQRRIRSGTWLFTQAHVHFDADEHAATAQLDRAGRAAMRDQLARDVAVLPIERGLAQAALVQAIAAVGR